MKRRTELLLLLALVFMAACGGGNNIDDDDTDLINLDKDPLVGPVMGLECVEKETIDSTWIHATGGTWTDPESGLTWQAHSSCDKRRTLEAATLYCEKLELGNKTDWRLPTISELRTLISDCPATMPGGECGVTDECHACDNDACSGCSYDGCHGSPNLSRPCDKFFSATHVTDASDSTWCVRFCCGAVTHCETGDDGEGEDLGYWVRCVRS